LINQKTVTYNWIQDPDSPQQIGFLAQDLEQYFPQLVATDRDGMKSVYYAQMTPILVEAIREMNLNVIGLTDYARPNSWRDAITAWLGDITNGIQKIFAKEIQTDKLCVGETCVTESQLQQLLQNQNIQATPPSDPTPTSPDPETVPSEDSNPPAVTPDPESGTPTYDPAPEPTPPPVTDTPTTE
jgi:hypothetical protein